MRVHFASLLFVVSLIRAEEMPVKPDTNGVWHDTLTSPYAVGTNTIAVLLPDHFDPAKKHSVLYVLPVEGRGSSRYGDGLAVIRKLNAHNRHNLIVAAPSFEIPPWFGNHATDPGRRYEDYMVKTVVPFIESRYPTTGTPEGRLLLGFSKSGWGAFTLILRNPDVFGYAASWDAPLMLTEKQFGVWQTDQNFGTPENMGPYLPSVLLRDKSGPFREKTRLVLAGKNLFGTMSDKRFPYEGPSHTEAAHALMEQVGVKHAYDPEVAAPHSWNPKWVGPVLEKLMQIRRDSAAGL
jgi:hypothetical protein